MCRACGTSFSTRTSPSRAPHSALGRFRPRRPRRPTPLTPAPSSIVPNVENCLRALRSVNAADRAITDRAETPFDPDNAEHESGLAELWQLLRPGRTRSGRKTKEWQELGFQGADPATDFRSATPASSRSPPLTPRMPPAVPHRGMGLLGLDQMLFMAREETDATRAMVDRAAGARGYPWAIVVIQLTSYTHSLLRARRVLVHFLSMGQDAAVRRFHQLTRAACTSRRRPVPSTLTLTHTPPPPPRAPPRAASARLPPPVA